MNFKGFKMTINDPKTVKDALLNNGVLEDLTFDCIYAYIGMDKATHYALFVLGQIPDMDGNPYVDSYVCLMHYGTITKGGLNFLNDKDPFKG